MPNQIVYPSSDEVKPFFFRGMIKAYPTGGIYVDGPFPGWKTFPYSEPELNLMLTDSYWTTPGSDRSGGVTLIYTTKSQSGKCTTPGIMNPRLSQL